jgi:hypothetical protein
MFIRSLCICISELHLTRLAISLFAVTMTIANTHASCPFNVAGLSEALLARDGLLLARYPTLGSSNNLTANTGAVANVSTIAQTIANNERRLDVNGNGAFDLDDAVIVARYLAGFRGEALKPVVANGMRTTGYEIEDYIANACAETACDRATGRVLPVGPGRTYATPSAAAAAAQSGDVIKIAAGDYTSNYATWNASNLTICGENGRARLFAQAAIPNGKAIWVTAGSDITIDSIEFHNATVPDQNGAGIRAEGNNLTVINSGFYRNENGILAGNAANSTITIERSVFAENGAGDGFSHNIYINNVARVNVRSSFFYGARIGHNFKTRARENVFENSYFMDGANGNSSYIIDFSNGGDVLMRGNFLHKGPNAENTSAAIAFGQEGLSVHPVNRLVLSHNTVVMQRTSGNFGGYIVSPSGTQTIELRANLLASTGSPALVVGGFNTANLITQNNVSTAASNIPGASSIIAPNFWPNASVVPLLVLSAPIDSLLLNDSPKPFVRRRYGEPARVIGALRSEP